MANTYDADLVVDRLAMGAITPLQNKLAPFGAFSRDFGADALRPRATVQVEKLTAGATGQQNPTNYESGDTTNTNVAVTVNEEIVSFHVASQELMQGHKLETKAEINAHVLADQVWDVFAALLDETVQTNAVIVAAESSLAAADLQDGWGSIAKSPEKHVVLNGTAYAQFLPTNRESFTPGAGAYGFDGFHLATKWDAAQDANTRGFFAGPNAFALASGMPVLSAAVENQLEARRSVTLPDLGLTVDVCLWGSTTSRATWASYGVMFGAAVSDATACTLYQTS